MYLASDIIVKLPLDGGTMARLASVPSLATAIVVDSTSVYWTTDDGTVAAPTGSARSAILPLGAARRSDNRHLDAGDVVRIVGLLRRLGQIYSDFEPVNARCHSGDVLRESPISERIDLYDTRRQPLIKPIRC